MDERADVEAELRADAAAVYRQELQDAEHKRQATPTIMGHHEACDTCGQLAAAAQTAALAVRSPRRSGMTRRRAIIERAIEQQRLRDFVLMKTAPRGGVTAVLEEAAGTGEKSDEGVLGARAWLVRRGDEKRPRRRVLADREREAAEARLWELPPRRDRPRRRRQAAAPVTCASTNVLLPGPAGSLADVEVRICHTDRGELEARAVSIELL